MIPESTVKVIQGLLREGIPHRKIATWTRVSRGTVSAIAQGRRKCRRGRPEDLINEAGTGLFVRCPSCGGLTKMPCMVCDRLILLEKALAKNRLTASPPDA